MIQCAISRYKCYVRACVRACVCVCVCLFSTGQFVNNSPSRCLPSWHPPDVPNSRNPVLRSLIVHTIKPHTHTHTYTHTEGRTNKRNRANKQTNIPHNNNTTTSTASHAANTIHNNNNIYFTLDTALEFDLASCHTWYCNFNKYLLSYVLCLTYVT